MARCARRIKLEKLLMLKGRKAKVRYGFSNKTSRGQIRELIIPVQATDPSSQSGIEDQQAAGGISTAEPVQER